MLHLSKMPTKKRRIGFIPKFDILRVIDNISEEKKLSNSKVVNILIEEALYARGLINKIEKGIMDDEFNNFTNKIGDLQKIFYEYDLKFDNCKDEFMRSKNNKIYMRFIQFLYFKKMMKIFEEYN